MEILYVLVPLSVVLITIALVIFSWAINSDQFDDLDTPAWRRVLNDESEQAARAASRKTRG